MFIFSKKSLLRYLSNHRNFGVHEEQYIRTMSPTLPYKHDINPGIRIIPEIITKIEAKDIWNESHKHIIPKFGLKGDFEKSDTVLIDGVKASTKMNLIRVTGRFENSKQRLAPWAYGDSFKMEKLPTSFQVLVKKYKNLMILSLDLAVMLP